METHNVTIAVGMLTTPRVPNTSTATLASLADAGWPDGVTVHVDCGSGCYRGWQAALRSLTAYNPTAEWLLLVEDDCQFSAGLRKYLEAGLRPGAIVPIESQAWHSLYCAAGLDDDSRCWRDVSAPRQCWGSLAYLFTRKLADRFLDNPPMPEWRDGTDQAVGRFCQREGIPYRIFSPSFVKHTGAVTSLDQSGGQEQNRQCKTWIKSIRLSSAPMGE